VFYNHDILNLFIIACLVVYCLDFQDVWVVQVLEISEISKHVVFLFVGHAMLDKNKSQVFRTSFFVDTLKGPRFKIAMLFYIFSKLVSFSEASLGKNFTGYLTISTSTGSRTSA
jgi:hypothetical protein